MGHILCFYCKHAALPVIWPNRRGLGLRTSRGRSEILVVCAVLRYQFLSWHWMDMGGYFTDLST